MGGGRFNAETQSKKEFAERMTDKKGTGLNHRAHRGHREDTGEGERRYERGE